ncbi:M1 family aminopeptidase [Arthrobacter sp. GCM10027362]|uniref:M1 family aminopeptidase n=1 Tax=Arthrobacter sp. GCM10027362 TaxID=3273379 RepID=UPI0036333D39
MSANFRSWTAGERPGAGAPAGRRCLAPSTRWWRRARTALGLAVVLAALPGTALAAPGPAISEYQQGSAGAGDPYFPLAGNGGYDVKHYQLDLDYNPPTDELNGHATISARAGQDLSSFNLDLQGLTVHSVQVDGLTASWTHTPDGELAIRPPRGISRGSLFRTVVEYGGSPQTLTRPGKAGFIHTPGGAVVTGHPLSAPTWFPVNNTPRDKATFSYRISVPQDWEVVANGALRRMSSKAGRTTFTWEADEPIVPYLASINVGRFDFREYTRAGVHYWDAVDPSLEKLVLPRNGNGLAWSRSANASYKRLARTISIPEDGATLSFWMDRDTEPGWDFAFVEARVAGADQWTTLQDTTGHATQDTGFSCPAWHEVHPFLKHYQSGDGKGGCRPKGSSGQWWAASGSSGGWEQWRFDLSGYAGKDVELAITYASDITGQHNGVLLEDIKVSTGEGSTSFEPDRKRDRLNGWKVSRAPKGSPANGNNWTAGVSAPPSIGSKIKAALSRQPRIIDFLSKVLGRYPFKEAGGVVTAADGLGFAMESQSRPLYAKDFFYDPGGADSLMVHQLAHQWFGGSVSVSGWKDAWLSDGFATYAQWLWNENQDLGTAQQTFEFYAGIPAKDQFWDLKVADPGPDRIFDPSLQARGAMVLQQLRTTVGDDTFFKILRRWVKDHAGADASTADFIRLAEEVSGKDLGKLFDIWLFASGKPGVL